MCQDLSSSSFWLSLHRNISQIMSSAGDWFSLVRDYLVPRIDWEEEVANIAVCKHIVKCG